MKKHASYFIVIVLLVALTACGPSQADLDGTATQSTKNMSSSQTATAPTLTPEPTQTTIPTSTFTPTSTPMPTATPFTTQVNLEDHSECDGNLYFLNPVAGNRHVGEIGGRDFSYNAMELKGAKVEITFEVIEAKHLVDEEAGLNGTYILAVINEEEGHYPVTVFIPMMNPDVFQHGTIWEVSGLHVGPITPPIGFFSSYADIGQEGYEGAFASMLVDLVTGPC